MTLTLRRGTDRTDVSPSTTGDALDRQLWSLLDSWPTLPALMSKFTPLADIEELDDAYLVELEVPGVKRGDINIEVAGRRVFVRGERKEKERVGIIRRRERTVGHFSCDVVLPGDVDVDHVDADLHDGVLTMRLPKPERDRRKRIPIR